MLSIAECQWPAAFSVVGFQQQGYGFAVGASALALCIATLDYFTHRPPNSKKEIIRVVEQFSGQKKISTKIKAALINMLCFGYLQEKEDSFSFEAINSTPSERDPLIPNPMVSVNYSDCVASGVDPKISLAQLG